MADEPPIPVIPLSGIRKTRVDSDPFSASVGESLYAQCGTFSLEGGFRQHGGIVQFTASAAGGAIVWMKRWYKPDGTKYFLALSDDGVLHLVATSSPATLSTLYSGLSGIPFSTAEINGWLYLSNGTDPFLRFDGTDIFEVGAAPPASPTFTATEVASGGTLEAGVYRFKVTYEYGTEGILGESNPAPGEVSVTVSANAAITLADLPVSSRTDATYKNIYRTLKDDTIYFWIARLPMNQLTYLIQDADEFLSAANFQLEEDHDVPGRLRHITVHRGRIFGEDPNVPGRIHLSLVDGSDVFPDSPIYYSDELGQDGEELVGLFRFGEGLFAAKQTKVWVLTGDSNENFIWDDVPSGRGFISGMSIARGDGVVYGLGPRDIQVFDGVNTVGLEKVRGVLDDVLNKADTIGIYRDKRYYLACQRGSSARRSLIVLVHPENNFEVSLLETTYDGGSQEFQVASLAVWENEGDRVFIGGYDGYIYEFDIGISWSRVGEDAAGATFLWRSNWIWGQGPAFFERYQKAYVMVESEGGTLTMDYEILTDNPNTTSTGSQTIDLNPVVTGASLRLGRWNSSRWG